MLRLLNDLNICTEVGLFIIIFSCCSGIVAAILSSPADLVKARVMNQPHDEKGRALVYKSSVDCLVKTVKNEGFFALYKGFLPCYIRMVSYSTSMH